MTEKRLCLRLDPGIIESCTRLNSEQEYSSICRQIQDAARNLHPDEVVAGLTGTDPAAKCIAFLLSAVLDTPLDCGLIRQSLDSADEKLQVCAAFCISARYAGNRSLQEELLLGRDAFTEPPIGPNGRYWLIRFMGLSGDRRNIPVLYKILRENYHYSPPAHTARTLEMLRKHDRTSPHYLRSITVSQNGSRILIQDDERFSGSSNCIRCRFFPCRVNRLFPGAIEDCKLQNRTDPATLFEVVYSLKPERPDATAIPQWPSEKPQAPTDRLLRKAEEFASKGQHRQAAQALKEAVALTNSANGKASLLIRAARLLIDGGDHQEAFGLLRLTKDKFAEADDRRILRQWESTYLALREKLGGYVGVGDLEVRTAAGKMLAELLNRLRKGPGTDRQEVRAVVSQLESILERPDEDDWNRYRWLSNLSSLCHALGEPEHAQRIIEKHVQATVRPAEELRELEHAVLLARQAGYLGNVENCCIRFAELLPRIRDLRDLDRRLEFLGYYLEALSRRQPPSKPEEISNLAKEAEQLFRRLLSIQPGSSARRRLRENHQRTLESALAALLSTTATTTSNPPLLQEVLGKAWHLILSSRNPELQSPTLLLSDEQSRKLRGFEDSLHRGLHYYLCAEGGHTREEFLEGFLRKVVDFELSAVDHRKRQAEFRLQPPESGVALMFFQFRELFPEKPMLVLAHRQGVFRHHMAEAADSRILGPLQQWWDRFQHEGQAAATVRQACFASSAASRTVLKEKPGSPPDDQQARALLEALLPSSLTGIEAGIQQEALAQWNLYPDGRLYGLPLELLPVPGSDRMLAERVGVRFCLRPAPRRSVDQPIDFRRGWLGLGGAPEQPHFSHLFGTVQEVKGISRFLLEQGFEKVQFLSGEEAHAENLVHLLRDSPPAVVHFAVHGSADTQYPDACALVLAIEPGGAAKALLPFRLIRQLPFQEVQLIILSACSSLIGPAGTGIGMEGLAWAFLEAGAEQVLGSRYPVGDEETLDFMFAFYNHLVEKPAVEALRQARVELLNQTHFSLREAGAWALWC